MESFDGEPATAVGSPSRSGDEPTRWAMTVAYDGTVFHGFAENRGVRTVAGDLRASIERVVGVPVRLSCAGRTDRGVHGHGQVVTFDLVRLPVDPARLVRSINRLNAPRLVVRDLRPVAADFDARFSAQWRAYRYRVLNSPAPVPGLEHLAWWVPDALDLDAMGAASVPLIGEHDFSAFCRRPKGEDPTTPLRRRILELHWQRMPADEAGLAPDGLLVLYIRATAFCHQMVRSITGMLVDAGRGRVTAADVVQALRLRDRAATTQVAPPHGLTLWEVGY